MNPNVRSAYVCDASSGYDFSNKFQQQSWTEKSINFDVEVFMQIRSDLIPHKYLQITQETTSVAT